MKNLEQFISLISGCFDNTEQYKEMQENGKMDYPYAEHVNTVCNDKIKNMPEDFKGLFLVEESYYTVNDKRNAASHLFLFTEEGKQIKLTSYDIPEGYDKNAFSYAALAVVDFNTLKASEKFTPALYTLKDGIWEGGSVSMFNPVVKFTLFERFSQGYLEVSETMEVNGKRTMGYDDAIIYKRV